MDKIYPDKKIVMEKIGNNKKAVIVYKEKGIVIYGDPQSISDPFCDRTIFCLFAGAKTLYGEKAEIVP